MLPRGEPPGGGWGERATRKEGRTQEEMLALSKRIFHNPKDPLPQQAEHVKLLHMRAKQPETRARARQSILPFLMRARS